MADLLSDLTSTVMAKCLDAYSMKHRAIADNIANTDTPGYVRSNVSFDDQLRDALSTSDTDDAESRVQELAPQTVTDTTTPAGPNGNNVSIDKEMADLTTNGLRYEALVRLMNIKGSMLLTAITEGKR